MSQHPSLKTSKVGKKHRTVLKRYERYSTIKEKLENKEDEDKLSVFGLPKLKIVRIKIKKEKAEEKPADAKAAGETKEAPQKETQAPKKEAVKAPKAEKKGK